MHWVVKLAGIGGKAKYMANLYISCSNDLNKYGEKEESSNSWSCKNLYRHCKTLNLMPNIYRGLNWVQFGCPAHSMPHPAWKLGNQIQKNIGMIVQFHQIQVLRCDRSTNKLYNATSQKSRGKRCRISRTFIALQGICLVWHGGSGKSFNK